MAILTRPIFLLSDWGLRDHYAGQCKAVIASIAPESPVVDLTHDVEPFAVDEGAWFIEVTLALLPPAAVLMAVVDPGVGTSRRALVLESAGRTFIGPDNGLLSGVTPELAPARRAGRSFEARRVAIPDSATIDLRELCEPSLMRPHVSNTFHGRDIFAPAAAHIASGADYRRAGPPQRDMVLLPPFRGRPAGIGILEGDIIHIDRFGNAITTIHGEQLFPAFRLEAGGRVIDTHVRTFAEAKPGTPFCHVDSSGYLGIALNRGNAAETLNLRRGDLVRVHAA